MPRNNNTHAYASLEKSIARAKMKHLSYFGALKQPRIGCRFPLSFAYQSF
jgi:hypothetical protein